MNIQELQEQIDLNQRIMDRCGNPENEFSIADALQGKEPSENYVAFQALVEEAHLDVDFFSNALPLHTHTEAQRDRYIERLAEKKLLQQGISIA